MHRYSLVCLLLLLAGPALQAQAESPPADGSAVRVPLSYAIDRSWDLDLPDFAPKLVAGSIPIPHQGGEGFLAVREGVSLLVDLDGDGATDVRADPPSALLQLRAKAPAGGRLRYAVRLDATPGGWTWRPSGMVVGTVDGVRIAIIDQNGDGRYDGVGSDAILVGSCPFASFLGETLSLGGKLYKLEVEPDGSALGLRPFDGPAGTLDLASGFQAEARLLSAVVQSTDGRQSFQLAPSPDGLLVPEGNYVLLVGMIGLGESRLGIARGRSKPIAVAGGEASRPSWGQGPVRAEFRYQRRGGKIAFDPRAIQYFGTGGEEYLGWSPLGESPVFVIANADTGEEVGRAVFPAKC